MPYEIHDTAHVEKRAKERGFTLQQAIETINAPAGILKTPPRRGNHDGMIWLFSRGFDGKVLIIVAEIKNHECWIITGYWA
jgi:hypothetical protein